MSDLEMQYVSLFVHSHVHTLENPMYIGQSFAVVVQLLPKLNRGLTIRRPALRSEGPRWSLWRTCTDPPLGAHDNAAGHRSAISNASSPSWLVRNESVLSCLTAEPSRRNLPPGRRGIQHIPIATTTHRDNIGNFSTTSLPSPRTSFSL